VCTIKYIMNFYSFIAVEERKKHRTLCKERDYEIKIFHSLLSAFHARLSAKRKRAYAKKL
jgi:hypothetical protein